jgi:hypothetical protein
MNRQIAGCAAVLLVYGTAFVQGVGRDVADAVMKGTKRPWQALDYAEDLVRVGVQSAIPHPDTAALIRKLMAERGLPVPPPNRVSDSICVVELCQ